MESIKRTEEIAGEDFTGIFDRGYDDNKIIDYMGKHKFVIRLEDKSVLLFKGKRRSILEQRNRNMILKT